MRYSLIYAMVMMVLIDCTCALMWSRARFVCHVLIYHRLFPSCFQVVPCLVWSETIHTECFKEIFVPVSWVSQYFYPDKPYYRTWCGGVRFIANERSDGRSIHLSLLALLSEKWKESHSNRTSVFWLLFYYLDISELMWAMIWEFPGARLQVFPPYHLRFSSATGFYYSPIWNLRSAIHSEQIDGVLNLVVLRMYIQSYFGACIKSWSCFYDAEGSI